MRKTFQPFSSLRTRLALLILLAMAPLLGLTIYTDLEERAYIISDAEEGVQRLAWLAAGTQEQLVEGARQFLTTLAKLPDVHRDDGERCRQRLGDLLREYPQYLNLGVVLPDGELLCSARPVSEPMSLARDEWFTRTVESREFTVGGYQVGRVSGMPTLRFSCPIVDESERLTGVLFAALDLEQLNQLTSEVQMPEGAEFILMDQGGAVLARLPDPDKWIGRNFRESPLVKIILNDMEGVEEVAGLDGVRRMYAFTPLRCAVDTGLYISVGIPLSIALAEANNVLKEQLIVMGMVSVLALLAVWYGGDLFILRRIDALVKASQRLAAGDMMSRTGISHGAGELGRLAHAFDEMAEALERRAVQLRQAEARYRTLVEQLPAITYTARLDEFRKTRYISPQVEAILGYSPDEWLADQHLWVSRIHPDDREQVLAAYRSSKSDLRSFSSVYRIYARDGRLLWFNDEAVVVGDESTRLRYLQGIMRDTTARKRAEEKLMEYQEQLRSLASQLALAEERERRRIATELHDRVGQTLAISKIKLGVLRQGLGPGETGMEVDEVRGLIESAIRDTRSLIFEISSPILYELGFEAAVEWLAEQTRKRRGISCSFENDGGPKPMDEDIRVLLFQAVSEILVNATKHSRARNVKVTLKREGDYIRVGVMDDGVGFDISEISSRWSKASGFGLFSIRERLRHVDGWMDIDSKAGRGTTVSLTAPLKGAGAGKEKRGLTSSSDGDI